jgi:hypothetical protein
VPGLNKGLPTRVSVTPSRTTAVNQSNNGTVLGAALLADTVVVHYKDGRSVWWGQRSYRYDVSAVRAVERGAGFEVLLMKDGTLQVIGSDLDPALAVPSEVGLVAQILVSNTSIYARTVTGEVFVWEPASRADAINLETMSTYAADLQSRGTFFVVRHIDGSMSAWNQVSSDTDELDIRSLRNVVDFRLDHTGIFYILESGELRYRWFATDTQTIREDVVSLTHPLRGFVSGVCSRSDEPTVFVRTDRGAVVRVRKEVSGFRLSRLDVEYATNEPVYCTDDLIFGFDSKGRVNAATLRTTGAHYSNQDLPVSFPDSLSGTLKLMVGHLGFYGSKPVGIVQFSDGSIRQFMHGSESAAIPYEVSKVHSLVRGQGYVGVVTPSGDALLWGDTSLRTIRKAIPLWAGDFIDINLDSSCAVGVHPDGSVIAWGEPDSCGGMSSAYPLTEIPDQIRNVRKIVSVGDFEPSAIVLRDDGTVWSWGGSAVEQLLPGTVAVTDTASSYGRTVFLHTDGSVTVTNNRTPQYVPPQVRDARLIAVNGSQVPGNYAYAALRTDGTLVVWNNSYAEEFTGFEQAIDIDLYADSVYVLLEDGKIAHWGSKYEIPTEVGTFIGVISEVEL